MKLWCVCGLLLAGALTHSAVSQNILRTGPDGVRAVDAGNAVGWAQRGYRLGLWRVRVVNGEPMWLRMSTPQVLDKKLASEQTAEGGQRSEDSNDIANPVDVEVQGGVVKLLWFEDVPKSKEDADSQENVSYEIVQASSDDYGNSWHVDRSAFPISPGTSVREYVALNANDAWLLAQDEPGAGQLPEALLTTHDGGRNWKLIAADGMPIGHNGGQVLSVKDASHAWFVATCWGCDEDETLQAAYTEDGGEKWHDAPLLQQYPGCATVCVPMELGSSAVADCLDVGLELVADSRVPLKREHFCSTDGGHTWQKPMVGVAGVSAAVVHPNPGAYGGLRMIRRGEDSGLGVGTSCTETVRLVETDPLPSCTFLETQDGGHSWRAVLPEMTARHMQGVNELVGTGSTDWLLLGMQSETKVLLWSADKGASWREVKLPGAQ